MPTGYTSDLYEGKPQTFEEFALGCARAFGALVAMRDMPLGSEIPNEIKPDPYHANKMEEAKAKITEYLNMDTEEADRLSYDEYLKATGEYARELDVNEQRKQRYLDMISKVEAWEPPTNDHVSMKQFMLDQLNESIRFDCSYAPTKPVLIPADEWLDARLAKAIEDLKYHREKAQQEEERAQSRSAWLKALRASL